MVESGDLCKIQSKRKAITAFFPYAVWRERGGEHGEIEAFLSAVKTSSSTTSLWHPIMPFISTLFNVASSQTILITSPHVPWDREPQDANAVISWANAASTATAAPRSEEVDERVVDALLHIASVDALRPHIPHDSWSWLNRRPSLPPMCQGRSSAKSRYVVSRVRGLRDPEILTSYLLLVWSEWDPIHPRRDLSEMRMTISREFRGSRMRENRKALIGHLDQILVELDRGLGYFKRFKLWIDENDIQLAKAQYGELRDNLVEIDKRETEVTTCESSLLTGAIIRLLISEGASRIMLDFWLMRVFSWVGCSCCLSPCSSICTSIVHLLSSLCCTSVRVHFSRLDVLLYISVRGEKKRAVYELCVSHRPPILLLSVSVDIVWSEGATLPPS